MSIKTAQEFVQIVRVNQGNIKAQLKELERNDWMGLVDKGKSLGLTFTPDELQAVFPHEFFRGQGARPDQGWDRIRYSDESLA